MARWGRDVPYAYVPNSDYGVLEAMADRITHIGLDHRIRRALGEDPEPGTLATLTRKTPNDDRPWWCWTPHHGSSGAQYALLEYEPEEMSDAYKVFPALAGITGPVEALAAIAASLETT